jgi:septum site-determining protein MinC
VAVKGSRDGLRILVSPGADPAAVVASLREQLSRRTGAFFLGATVVLELPPGELDLGLVETLAPVIATAGMRLVAVEAAGSRPAAAPELPRPAAAAVPVVPPEAALVVGHTLRSGQRVAHAGAVVVLGDVNPGAEVVAGGSVVVWGRLRGTVEAGLAEGPAAAGAVVCALDLAPTQLRIGPALARAPEEPDRSPVPEVARLQEGRIVVEAWR